MGEPKVHGQHLVLKLYWFAEIAGNTGEDKGEIFRRSAIEKVVEKFFPGFLHISEIGGVVYMTHGIKIPEPHSLFDGKANFFLHFSYPPGNSYGRKTAGAKPGHLWQLCLIFIQYYQGVNDYGSGVGDNDRIDINLFYLLVFKADAADSDQYIGQCIFVHRLQPPDSG